MAHSIWPPLKLLILGLTTGFISIFPFGFQLGVTGLTSTVIKQFIKESHQSLGHMDVNLIWGLITSIPFISCMAGGLLASYLADTFGRRPTLFCYNNVVCIAGAVLAILSKVAASWELLVVARFVTGFAAGIALVIFPVYITECSPARCRGIMGSLIAPCGVACIALAQILSLESLLGNEFYWNLLYGMGLIISLVQFGFYFLFPETPQYDLIFRHDGRAAMATILKYFGNSGDSDNTLLVEETFQQFENQRDIRQQKSGIFQCVRDKSMRPTLLLVIVITMFRTAAGSYLVFIYTGETLASVGVSESYLHIISILMQVAAIILSTIGCITVEYVGRRHVIIGSAICFIFCWISLLCQYIIKKYFVPDEYNVAMAWISVGILSMLYIANLFGVATISFFIAAELCSQHFRSALSAIGLVTGSFTYFVSVLAYPIMADWNYIATVLILFIVPLLVAVIFMYFRLPETRNRPIMDIVEEIRTRAGNKPSNAFRDDGNSLDFGSSSSLRQRFNTSVYGSISSKIER